MPNHLAPLQNNPPCSKNSVTHNFYLAMLVLYASFLGFFSRVWDFCHWPSISILWRALSTSHTNVWNICSHESGNQTTCICTKKCETIPWFKRTPLCCYTGRNIGVQATGRNR